MSVAVAGSTVHFLLALVLIFTFLVFPREWTVSYVAPDSPAQRAGLEADDRIMSVDGIPVDSMDELVAVLPEPGSPVSLSVQRSGEVHIYTLTLGVHPRDTTRGYVGIGSRSGMGLIEAVPETFDEFGFLVKESVLGIGRFFSPSGLNNFFRDVTDQPVEQVTAPADSAISASAPSDNQDRVISIFGALRIGADLTENGYGDLLLFLALLNVFIGVFNLIPLLPFDGGHVVIATYERLRSWGGHRYTADVSKMVPVAYAVILILGFVFIGSVYLDFTDPVEVPS